MMWPVFYHHLDPDYVKPEPPCRCTKCNEGIEIGERYYDVPGFGEFHRKCLTMYECDTNSDGWFECDNCGVCNVFTDGEGYDIPGIGTLCGGCVEELERTCEVKGYEE